MKDERLSLHETLAAYIASAAQTDATPHITATGTRTRRVSDMGLNRRCGLGQCPGIWGRSLSTLFISLHLVVSCARLISLEG